MHTPPNGEQVDKEVAGADPGRTEADSSDADSTESSAQHGIRGRAGDGSLGGSAGTTTEHVTRYIETRGIQRYRELAPLIADCVVAVENRFSLYEVGSHP
jgi:hypothetical protein